MKKKPLNIGNLTFEYPFVLAPLAGITDRSMRSLCSQAGASLAYTEMVSARGLWYGDRKTAELLAVGEEEGPVGFQLFGHEPEVLSYAVRAILGSDPAKAGDFAEALKKIPGPPPKPWRSADGKRPVVFDLNAGCPVPKIVKNGEGSALLKDPQLLHDCVAAMCEAAGAAAREAPGASGETAAAEPGALETASREESMAPVPVPVTVKIRKGFSRDESSAVENALAAEAAGAAAVTVHGRTREQYYEGKADWSVIAAVKKAVKIPVIGNGDVTRGADALRMMEETGCDGVMIARGALGNPWIFREARALWDGRELPAFASEEERLEMLCHHLDLVCEDKGEPIAVREIRKFVGWYTKGIHGAAAVRRQINMIDSAEEMKRIIRTLERPR